MRLNQLFLTSGDWTTGESYINLDIEKAEGFLVQHQLAFEIDDGNGVISIPSTGTITVTVKSPGGSIYHSIVDGTVNVTDRGEWIKRCLAHVESFKFTPSGLDTGYRYKVILVSSF